MTMTTKGNIKPADTRATVVDTEANGKPSVADGASTQSPAGLVQPKGPTTVATIKQ